MDTTEKSSINSVFSVLRGKALTFSQLPVPECSFLWQRVCHDSYWSVELGVSTSTPAASAGSSRCRNDEVLSPAKFIHGRRPTSHSTQLKLRQLLAVSAFVHMN